MRETFRFSALGLSLTVACILAVAPPAGSSTTGSTATSHSGTTTGASTSTNAAGGGTATARYSGGGGLLCAGLLESGVLGDVFTVAPVSTARREDLGSAIQFAPIWSDSHQATVGDTTQVEPPKSKPAVAILKLPISFSDADRQKFAAAGWKPHKSGALGITYCLDRTQGMICVTAAP